MNPNELRKLLHQTYETSSAPIPPGAQMDEMVESVLKIYCKIYGISLRHVHARRFTDYLKREWGKQNQEGAKKLARHFTMTEDYFESSTAGRTTEDWEKAEQLFSVEEPDLTKESDRLFWRRERYIVEHWVDFLTTHNAPIPSIVQAFLDSTSSEI